MRIKYSSLLLGVASTFTLSAFHIPHVDASSSSSSSFSVNSIHSRLVESTDNLQSIDLSYQFNHDRSALIDAVLDAIDSMTTQLQTTETTTTTTNTDTDTDTETMNTVTLDVSSTMMNDDGIFQLMEALSTQQEQQQQQQSQTPIRQNQTIDIHLKLRSNHLTSKGVSQLLEQVFQFNVPPNNTIFLSSSNDNNNNNTTTTTTPTNTSNVATMESENESNESVNLENATTFMKTLDSNNDTVTNEDVDLDSNMDDIVNVNTNSTDDTAVVLDTTEEAKENEEKDNEESVESNDSVGSLEDENSSLDTTTPQKDDNDNDNDGTLENDMNAPIATTAIDKETLKEEEDNSTDNEIISENTIDDAIPDTIDELKVNDEEDVILDTSKENDNDEVDIAKEADEDEDEDEDGNDISKSPQQLKTESELEPESISQPEPEPIPMGRITIRMESLDLAFNHLGQKRGSKQFHKSLCKLIASHQSCPSILRLNQCGLSASTCRSIGKGILKRCSEESNTKTNTNTQKPISLYLGGNPNIGDVGAASIAAALRIAHREQQHHHHQQQQQQQQQQQYSDDNNDNMNHIPTSPLLETLDLSSCGITDVGAEALALALEGSPGCIQHLILSNNRISDPGAKALGNALQHGGSSNAGLHSLNLDSNKDIGDKGVAPLANAMERSNLHSLSIRSCSIQADGSMALGRALSRLAFLRTTTTTTTSIPKQTNMLYNIDMSGNSLGIHRIKKEKKSSVSTRLLKSKASATTKSYMNFIGKKITGGLKDVAGVDMSQYFSTSAESDDDFEDENVDEESTMDQKKNKNQDVLGFDGLESMMTSAAKCGARAFVDPVMTMNEEDETEKNINGRDPTVVEIGMRLCSLDKGGADALAALIVKAKETLGLDIRIDASMNAALDAEMISALDNNNNKGKGNNDIGDDMWILLQTMAKRHTDALEALRIARERAAAATSLYTGRNEGFSWNDEDDLYDEYEEDDFMQGDNDEDEDKNNNNDNLGGSFEYDGMYDDFNNDEYEYDGAQEEFSDYE